MKKVIFYSFLAFISIGCAQQKGSEEEAISSADSLNQALLDNKEIVGKHIPVMLEGVWAENEDENAWYLIKSDSVYFVEHPETPVKYLFENDTLKMFFDGYVSSDRVVKLTIDSLWVFDEMNEKVIKLYKR